MQCVCVCTSVSCEVTCSNLSLVKLLVSRVCILQSLVKLIVPTSLSSPYAMQLDMQCCSAVPWPIYNIATDSVHSVLTVLSVHGYVLCETLVC